MSIKISDIRPSCTLMNAFEYSCKFNESKGKS